MPLSRPSTSRSVRGGRLLDRLVVGGEVVDDVLALVPSGPDPSPYMRLDTVPDDVGDLVAERRIPGDDRAGFVAASSTGE
jgi:hypothetical protein